MEEQTTGELAEALAKAQAAIQNPKRDRTVRVRSKRTGAEYEFTYATLGAILDCIRKPLTDNGLWFVQMLEQGAESKYRLKTVLLHASGETLTSETPLLVEEQGNQAFGSALTYMRRYALTAMLGISADEDDDGNAAEGNSAQKHDRLAKPKQEAPEKPHAIPVPLKDDKADWVAFGGNLVAKFTASANEGHLDLWWHENLPALSNCEKDNEKVHRRIVAQLEKRRAELTA